MSKVPETLVQEYEGKRFRVVHCDGAVESYREALKHVNANKAKSFTRGIIVQIKRLVDGQPMSSGSFPKEGELPKRLGQQKTKYFRALKRIPLRGYCWRSETRPNTYFISHYVHKDYNNLASKHIRKVGNKWHRIEVCGDDY